MVVESIVEGICSARDRTWFGMARERQDVMSVKAPSDVTTTYAVGQLVAERSEINGTRT